MSSPARKHLPDPGTISLSLLSASVLLFEVVLIRVFSVTLWYHLANLVLSLAMLGYVLGTILVFLVFRKRQFQKRIKEYTAYGCTLGFAVTAAVALTYHLRRDLSIYTFGEWGLIVECSVEVLLFTIPFVLAASATSLALFYREGQISAFYSWDMIGAATGALLGYILTDWVSAPTCVFAVLFLGSCSALVLTFNQAIGSKPRLLACALILISVFVGVQNDSKRWLSVRFVKSYDQQRLQQPESGVSFEKWGSASRITVTHPILVNDEEMMRVSNDAGAPTSLVHPLVPVHPSKSEFESIRHRLNIAYLLKQDADVLVIGAGGGRQVLYALQSGQKSVDAVEVNKLTLNLVLDKYSGFTGDIFHDSKVRTIASEGRFFLARTHKNYDLIDISMIDSWIAPAGGAYFFQENRLYTVEALQLLFSRLKRDGIFSVIRYANFGEGLRLALLARSALEGKVPNPEKHIAVTSMRSPLLKEPLIQVLVKNGEFDSADFQVFESEKKSRPHFSIVYFPGVGAPSAPNLLGDEDIRRVIDPARFASQLPKNWWTRLPDDVSPAIDDRPFFFFTTKFLDALVGAGPVKRHSARKYAVTLLIWVTLALGAILVGTSVVIQNTKATETPFTPGLYFSASGIGYALATLPQFQILSGITAQPALSFVITQGTLLAASALGSALTKGRIPRDTIRQKLIQIVSIVVFLVGGLSLVPHLDPLTSAVAPVFLVFVFGLFVGASFPLAIENFAGPEQRGRKTLYFMLSGLGFLFGTNLAFLLSIFLGFTVALACAVMSYLVALACIVFWSR